MAWQTAKLDWNENNYLNPEELNKIEGNTVVIANYLKQLIGADAGLDNPITNRDYSSIEFADGFNRIEGNIKKVSDILPLSGMVTLKTTWQAGDSISYKDINRMENNLDKLFNVLNTAIATIDSCGEFDCGEEAI